MALIALSAAMVFMVGYGIVMLFFMWNNSWIGPTVLSKTSKEMLEFSEGYQTAMQAMTTDEVIRDQSSREYQNALINYSNLVDLTAQFEQYRVVVKKPIGEKAQNILSSTALANDLELNKQYIQDSLKAGLITKVDSLTALANIQQFRNSVPDSVLMLNSTAITARQQYVQIEALRQQAQSDVETRKAAAAAAAVVNYNIAKRNIDTLKGSVYYDAYYNNGSNLAFIPYENMNSLKIGSPIYGCHVEFIFCKRVGTVKHIYTDEQLVQFPLFNVRLNRTDRGVFIDMDLTEKRWATATVLYINHAPLFF